jgi:ribosomal protein L29
MGIQKPNGGCGKGLLCKPGRGKGLAIPIQKAISKETAGSSSQPLRFKRKNKPTLKPCAIFEEDEEPAPREDPQITSLKNKVADLREEVRILKAQLSDSNVKATSIEFQLNSAIFSLRHSIAKVAWVA